MKLLVSTSMKLKFGLVIIPFIVNNWTFNYIIYNNYIIFYYIILYLIIILRGLCLVMLSETIKLYFILMAQLPTYHIFFKSGYWHLMYLYSGFHCHFNILYNKSNKPCQEQLFYSIKLSKILGIKYTLINCKRQYFSVLSNKNWT